MIVGYCGYVCLSLPDVLQVNRDDKFGHDFGGVPAETIFYLLFLLLPRMLLVLLYPFPCAFLVFPAHTTVQLCLSLRTALFHTRYSLAIAYQLLFRQLWGPGHMVKQRSKHSFDGSPHIESVQAKGDVYAISLMYKTNRVLAEPKRWVKARLCYRASQKSALAITSRTQSA